jgi:hypothetical protein
MLQIGVTNKDIESSVPGTSSVTNTNLYDCLFGTSMAAPHVAGAYAAVRSACPNATVDQILTALKDTGIPITDTRLGGTETKPRIRVDLAVQQLACKPPRAEYCRFVGDTPNIHLSCAIAAGNSFGNTSVDAYAGLNRGFDILPHLMADVNGDGKADYCRFISPPEPFLFTCNLQTATGFGGVFSTGSPGDFDGYLIGAPAFLADVNGDGKADYCRYVRDPADGVVLRCDLSTWNGFNGVRFHSRVDLGNTMGLFMVDVNGDGKADYCRFVGTAPNIFLSCALSSGTAFGAYDVNSAQGFDAGYDNMGRFMADVNGDGMADFCRFVGTAPNIFLSCALSSGTAFGGYDVNSAQGFDAGYGNMPRFIVSTD